MSKHLEVTGATSPPGAQRSVAPRLESHDFVKDKKFFSLYIQAIERCQKTSEDLVDSYFQIAGIHGLPYVRWDGAGPEQPVEVPAGYCQHFTTIFTTWHRPYCALYEQTINRHAIDIAAECKVDRGEWQKAAGNLRLPYWDWAVHPLPPKEFYDHRQFSQVAVILPDGTSGKVDNPLLAYKFHTGKGPAPPKDANFDWKNSLADFPATVRHPTGPNSTSDVDIFEGYLIRQFERTRRDIAALLLKVDDWFKFGTQAAGSGSFTNSLEALHGSLHFRIGLGGHMNQEPYAAFDPIFFLHHSNVDRVLALWQAIHYRQWVSPQNDSAATWVTKRRTLVDENTPLAPFWKSQTNFWTSAQCRDWTVLHYTYPEFDGLQMTDTSAISEAITRRAHDLYYDDNTFPAFSGPIPTVPAAPPATPQVGFTTPMSATFIGRTISGLWSVLTRAGRSTRLPESIEWTVRIRCKQADLYKTSSIFIFLGGRPSDGNTCINDERFAGSYDPFVNPYPQGCRNCVDNVNTVLEGFIHITADLIRQGLDVMDVGRVKDYLQQNLKWAVWTHGGEYGRVEDLKSLEVTVIDTPIYCPEGAEIPLIGGVRKHNEVTFDKPGGRVRVPGYPSAHS